MIWFDICFGIVMPCLAACNRRHFSPLLVSGLLLLFSESFGLATDRYWNGGQDNIWGNKNNWIGNKVPGSGDNAVFNSTFTNQPTLNANVTVGGIWITTGIGQNVIISATSGVLSLQGNTINGTAGLGILLDNTSAFTLTISAPIQLSAAQSWLNNSGNLFTISGAVNLNAKALTIDGTGNTLISGLLSSSGAFTKLGAGTLSLSNTTNSYSGQLTVQVGTLKIDTINNASANGELGNSSLSVILGGVGQTGTLEYTGATASSTKRFTMATGGTGSFQIDSAGTNVTLSGVIDGSGGLLKNGLGILTLTGSNTYSGGTSLVGGTLQLASLGTLGSTGGSLMLTSGSLDLNGTSQTVGTLGGTGGTILNNASSTSSVLTIGSGGGSASYAGVIADNSSGTGTLGLTKTGAGTQTLTGVNTYTGATTVNGGALFINGSTAFGSIISVYNSGTTLGGSGTINGNINLVSSGTNLSPGASGVGSISILRTGSVTLAIGSNLNIDINGSVAGTGYDQVKVTGTLSIAGSNLNVTAGGSLSIGQVFYIVLNDGTDSITGTFAQGTSVTASNGDVFSINYAANGDGGTLGNDISLTVTALPEPANWISAIAAVGLLVYHERRKFSQLLSNRRGLSLQNENRSARES